MVQLQKAQGCGEVRKPGAIYSCWSKGTDEEHPFVCTHLNSRLSKPSFSNCFTWLKIETVSALGCFLPYVLTELGPVFNKER